MADDFGDFTGFNSGPTNGSAMAQTQQSKLPPLQFDINFQIPPPMSKDDSDVHMAGGVPFEIPPLPFDDFSPEPDLDNPLGTKFPMTTTISEPSVSGDVFMTSAAQPVAFGDFASTDDQKPPTVKSDSKDGWAADFDSFSIPPPLDLTESVEGVSDPTPMVSEASTDVEQFGDFSAFETGNPTNTTSSSTTVDDKADLNESIYKADPKPVSMGNKNEDTSAPVLPLDDGFGAFSTGLDNSESRGSDVVFTSKGVGNEFASFGNPSSSNDVTQNEIEKSTENTSFKDINTSSSSNEFANFAAFQEVAPSSEFSDVRKDGSSSSNSFPTDSSSQATTLRDEFGEFNSSQVVPEPSNTDDFGDFSGPSNAAKDDFGAFSGTSKTAKDDVGDFSGTSNTAKDDFGDFSGTSNTAKDDFGDFSGNSNTAKDDFGGFSGTSNTNFGDFSNGSGFSDFKTSSGNDFGTFSTVSVAPTESQSKSITSQDVDSVLLSCFSLMDLARADVMASKIISLLQNADKSAWVALQKCIDLTVPLYKWEKSSLQDNYYTAIKVDPMLVSRPSTLTVLTGQVRFEDPLGGTTAAEDLIESFGFQGEVEETPARPRSTTSPSVMGSGRPRALTGDRNTPTLLDLSLPDTPGSPTGHNSFTLAEDLLGLDLNPQPKTQQLTSIEELHRNEQLVVNKSKWVDSELEEFGESSQPSTPQTAKKQNNVEFQLQQLGLDANKVSSYRGNKMELSLAARTVLGRLPELSFMLTDSIVEPQKYSV